MPISGSTIYGLPILIVEDNEINRVTIEKTLRAGHFTNVLAVADAEEALKQMELFNPELIILDVFMPGMNGFEYCTMLRQQPKYQNLPILMQTIITEPELRVKAFEMGATDFISKPVYADELYARVKVHLQNRLYVKNLRLYKDRIETELNSARQLQFSILPQTDEIMEIERHCGLEIASYFKPSSEIGGDFWGTKNLLANQTALWMVDFSGHGVAAALNAFRLQAYLKEHSPLAVQPGNYLSHLNDKLLQLLLRGQFATMFYGVVDTRSNQLFYACACNPHPMLVRRASGKVDMLDGSGTPLGVSAQLYQTRSTPFMPGDTLLLYSDVLTEAPNASGEFIREETILDMLAAHHDASAASIIENLLNHFIKHSGGIVTDDLTLCVCKRKGKEAHG